MYNIYLEDLLRVTAVYYNYGLHVYNITSTFRILRLLLHPFLCMQSRPSTGTRELDLSRVQVHFSSADPFAVLGNVLTELQRKGLLPAGVISPGKQHRAEEQMKHLVSTMASHDSKDALVKLFEVTSGLAIAFSNLPEVSIIIICKILGTHLNILILYIS